ncbi:MAG: ATP-dependent RecD-like DNA helicase [Pseudomonadota bacterium]
MAFSPQQDDALRAVAEWLALPVGSRQPIFRLFGFAGTGKTTLARHIAEDVDGDVQFGAFTGKAAQVLRNKGAANARTIHSLIYRPRGEGEEDEDGKFSPAFSLNRQSNISKAELIIIDECSMVDEDLGRDLLSFGVPVLVLGDPGQLPPVSGGGFFTEAEPDFMLTEVHRQARDNPIIDLAMRVREGGQLSHGSYGESAVISRDAIDRDAILDADQVLVGTNRTRQRYNARLRELKGFDGRLPQSGDRLVCLRNDAAKGLLNGSLWNVKTASARSGPALHMLVQPEDDGGQGSAKIKVLKEAFEGNSADIPWQSKRRYDDFDFGYALTVHKSQGSQWDDVFLFDESYAFKDSRERWLYTAITRAAERITIVR